MKKIELKKYELAYEFLYIAGYTANGTPAFRNIYSKCILPLRTAEGLKQFRVFQSGGVRPKDPDDFFLVLEFGKYTFDNYQKYLKAAWYGKSFNDMYLGIWYPPWDGWYCLWVDFEFQSWIIPLLTAWHKDRPQWVDDGNSPDSIIYDNWLEETKEKFGFNGRIREKD